MNLREEIAVVLNRHSAENGSNTPDFILAKFLESCLLAFDTAVRARARWYGRSDRPAQSDPPKIETDRSMPRDRVDFVDKRGVIIGQITELGDCQPEAPRYVAGKNLVRPTFAAEPDDPNEEHLSAHPEFGEKP